MHYVTSDKVIFHACIYIYSVCVCVCVHELLQVTNNKRMYMELDNNILTVYLGSSSFLIPPSAAASFFVISTRELRVESIF